MNHAGATARDAAPGVDVVSTFFTDFDEEVQRRLSGNGLFRCSYLLSLEDGDIILEGLDPRGPGEYTLAVTGGTGAYRDARGEALFTDTSTGVGAPVTDMVIDLSRN